MIDCCTSPSHSRKEGAQTIWLTKGTCSLSPLPFASCPHSFFLFLPPQLRPEAHFLSHLSAFPVPNLQKSIIYRLAILPSRYILPILLHLSTPTWLIWTMSSLPLLAGMKMLMSRRVKREFAPRLIILQPGLRACLLIYYLYPLVCLPTHPPAFFSVLPHLQYATSTSTATHSSPPLSRAP